MIRDEEIEQAMQIRRVWEATHAFNEKYAALTNYLQKGEIPKGESINGIAVNLRRSLHAIKSSIELLEQKGCWLDEAAKSRVMSAMAIKSAEKRRQTRERARRSKTP